MPTYDPTNRPTSPYGPQGWQPPAPPEKRERLPWYQQALQGASQPATQGQSGGGMLDTGTAALLALSKRGGGDSTLGKVGGAVDTALGGSPVGKAVNAGLSALGGAGGTGVSSLPLSAGGSAALNPALHAGTAALGIGGAAGAGLSSLPLSAGGAAALNPALHAGTSGLAAGGATGGAGSSALAALPGVGLVASVPLLAKGVNAFGDWLGSKMPDWMYGRTPYDDWDSYAYYASNRGESPTEEGYQSWESQGRPSWLP